MSDCKHCCSSSHVTSEKLSYAQIPVNIKINLLSHLITTINFITGEQDSKEYAQLHENSEELTSLKEFLQEILQKEVVAPELDTCNSLDILGFIQKHQDQLKLVSSSLYLSALQAILQGKDQMFPENPASFAEHPIAFYSQLLNDFAETRFFAMNDEAGKLITQTFNYCCQKLYNECGKLEEVVTKKLILNVVDCIWLFTLLEKHKNEIIYVMGGWRYANTMVILEGLRQQYADQSLENLDEQSMLKLMEALTTESSMLDDEEDDEDELDDNDENEQDDCCHEDCCGKNRN